MEPDSLKRNFLSDLPGGYSLCGSNDVDDVARTLPRFALICGCLVPSPFPSHYKW